MERTVDTIFTKRSVIRTKDPYSLALAIKEIAGRYGTVKERLHEYDTNGPRKLVKMRFDVIRRASRHAAAKIRFTIRGEIGIATSFLDVRAVGKSMIATPSDEGFVVSAYGDFYMKSISPHIRKENESCLKDMSAGIEAGIKGVLYKYA